MSHVARGPATGCSIDARKIYLSLQGTDLLFLYLIMRPLAAKAPTTRATAHTQYISAGALPATPPRRHEHHAPRTAGVNNASGIRGERVFSWRSFCCEGSTRHTTRWNFLSLASALSSLEPARVTPIGRRSAAACLLLCDVT